MDVSKIKESLENYKVSALYMFSCELEYLMTEYIKQFENTDTIKEDWQNDCSIKEIKKESSVNEHIFKYKNKALFSFSDVYCDKDNFNIMKREYKRIDKSNGNNNKD